MVVSIKTAGPGDHDVVHLRPNTPSPHPALRARGGGGRGDCPVRWTRRRLSLTYPIIGRSAVSGVGGLCTGGLGVVSTGRWERGLQEYVCVWGGGGVLTVSALKSEAAD